MTGGTVITDREYHGPSGAMIIEENKRLKAELAEALANEQSSAKAYAESQARETVQVKELEMVRDALQGFSTRQTDAKWINFVNASLNASRMGLIIGANVWKHCERIDSARRRLDAFLSSKEALSFPAPDLVGVIKTLSAALVPFAGDGMLSAAQGMSDEVIVRFEASAREVRQCEAALSSTREIRERIGAV